jgi:sirohydrochlorin ferrochelatase
MSDGEDDPVEAQTRLRERGASDRSAWYDDGSLADPRPWEAALRETETPSIREYLAAAREEGATTRALALVGLVLSMLIVVPAALVAGMITLMAFSLVERPVLVWAGLTVVVLVVLVGWLETRGG